MTAWASEGGARGSLAPPGFRKFQQKGYFFYIKWEKTNITNFGPPLENFLKNSPSGSPPEKILPNPMHDRTALYNRRDGSIHSRVL